MGITAHWDDPEWVTLNAPQWCYENPTASICEEVPQAYEYEVSLAANVTFLVIFLLSLIGYLVVYGLTRRGGGFTFAMALGLICEVLGYAGRIMGAKNPWDVNGFLMQICCLTIGPAFMAAGVYLCLRRIVTVYGPENSRIKPQLYTRIFIPCDVLALIFQALGGALASIASSQQKSADLGSNIMIVGLVIQVLTGLGFVIAASDFGLRVYRRRRQLGPSIFPQEPELIRLRSDLRFKGSLVAIGLAAFCILWRSIFRVAELSQGWTGELMKRQDLFIGFEGVLIVVAVLGLNVFHPSLCSPELMKSQGGGLAGLKGKFGGKYKKAAQDEPMKEMYEPSTSSLPNQHNMSYSNGNNA